MKTLDFPCFWPSEPLKWVVFVVDDVDVDVGVVAGDIR